MGRMTDFLVAPLSKPLLQPLRGAIGFATSSIASAVRALFSSGQQGAWYDPGDLDTAKLTFRRNLLTSSEDFSNAVWVKVLGVTTTGPNTLNFTSTSGQRFEFVASTAVANTSLTFSVDLSGTGTINIAALTTTGVGGSSEITVTLTAVPTRYSVTVTYSAGATGNQRVFIIWRTGNTATQVTANKAQFEPDTTATTYQKITDYLTEFLAAFPTHTLYQDSAGVTPVTAVEQPVGLMLDKRLGLVRGPNLAPGNGQFTTSAGWSVPAGTSISGGVADFDGTAASPIISASAAPLIVGRAYEITFTITRYVAGLVDITTDGGTWGTGYKSALGTYKSTAVACNGTALFVRAASNFNGSIDNLIIAETVAGNHASQATAASRPVLSARVNLLTKTDQLSDAAWGKVFSGTGVIPALTDNYLGETGVSRVQVNRGAAGVVGDQSTVTQIVSSTVGLTYFMNSEVKATSAGEIGKIINQRGAAGGSYRTITLTADWQNFGGAEVAFSATANFEVGLRGTFGSSQTADFLIRLSQHVLGTTATRYQRVNTATDYDTAGFPMYLRFDGVDDSLATDAINFSATDKMTVFAGAMKLSDVTPAIITEFTTSSVNSGSFYLAGPLNNGIANFGVGSSGTVGTSTTVSGLAAPFTGVMTMQSDIAAPRLSLSVNRQTPGVSVASQGTGNFANAALFIGSRANTSLFFNGRIYSLIIRGTASSAAEIAAAERFVASKTGVLLP